MDCTSKDVGLCLLKFELSLLSIKLSLIDFQTVFKNQGVELSLIRVGLSFLELVVSSIGVEQS